MGGDRSCCCGWVDCEELQEVGVGIVQVQRLLRLQHCANRQGIITTSVGMRKRVRIFQNLSRIRHQDDMLLVALAQWTALMATAFSLSGRTG
jgi:hypothetical protein